MHSTIQNLLPLPLPLPLPLLPLLLLAVVQLATAQNNSYTDPETFRAAIIDTSNTYRSEHNAAPLTWNDTLAAFAADYAGRCVFEHSGGPYGENLAAGYANATSAVQAWGDEREQYDYNGEFSEETGHFTQLVWKATTDVGCGAAECEGVVEQGVDSWLLVCEYWPPGNVEGGFGENVERQRGNESGAGRRRRGVGRGALVGAAVVGVVGGVW